MCYARADHTRENYRPVAAEKRSRQKFEGVAQDQAIFVQTLHCVTRAAVGLVWCVAPSVRENGAHNIWAAGGSQWTHRQDGSRSHVDRARFRCSGLRQDSRAVSLSRKAHVSHHVHLCSPCRQNLQGSVHSKTPARRSQRPRSVSPSWRQHGQPWQGTDQRWILWRQHGPSTWK